MRIEETIDRILGRSPPERVKNKPRRVEHPRSSEDSAAALRVLKTLRLLQSRWWRVKELAERTGRDEKTMRRDLATIRKAGFRVEVKVEAFGRKAYRAKLHRGKQRGRVKPPTVDQHANYR